MLSRVLLSMALGTLQVAVSAGEPPREALVVRVYYEDPAQIRQLTGFDLFEFHDREAGYVLVGVDDDDLATLRQRGFRVEIDQVRTDAFNYRPPPLAGQTSGIPGFPCYRTVEETYARMVELAAERPWLATWTDVGDSWERVVLDDGYDLRVLRLTNSRLHGNKPKLFLTCSIHAREYAPGELCTRFVERLYDGYGDDADTTWILDQHEVHVMMLANPDGRKQAEAGLSWRKNTDQDYCGPMDDMRGADLNRNFDFEWGCCGGASDNPCSPLYRGPTPGSEPETKAVQEYLRSQFDDRRGSALTDPAPADTAGIYIDIHSFGRLVLWPWGFTEVAAPNAAELATLGRRLAAITGYTPGPITDLTTADGSTADFGYGELGIAAMAYEIGNTFFQDCSTFEDTILEPNLASLLYAARTARLPYVLPAGPDTSTVVADPSLVAAGEPITLTAVVDDAPFEGSGHQHIVAAEYFVDTPPWQPGAVARPMAPEDGVFDTPSEGVVQSIDTAGLAPGRHIVFVRGRDADGNHGPVGAAFFDIAFVEGSVSGTLTAEGSGAPLAGTVKIDALNVAAASDASTGAYTLALPPGSWILQASAPNHFDRQIPVVVEAGASANADFDLTPAAPVLLVDDDADTPDVQSVYTDLLDFLGRPYVVWDTAADGELSESVLANHETAIWFTGNDAAGPGPGFDESLALASWLPDGRCLMIASQDYFSTRGATPFMRGSLGLDHGRPDVGESGVTGIGALYGQVGSFSLDPPYENRSDSISPATGESLGYVGGGDAAIVNDAGHFRTVWLGFGIEAILGGGSRTETLEQFLAWCDALPVVDADFDGDGVSNQDDCSPTDPAVWREPGPARKLVVTREALRWDVSELPGGPSSSFDVLRTTDPTSFTSAACVVSSITETTIAETFVPASEQAAFYLVRSRNPCGSNLGVDTSGTSRVGIACAGVSKTSFPDSPNP